MIKSCSFAPGLLGDAHQANAKVVRGLIEGRVCRDRQDQFGRLDLRVVGARPLARGIDDRQDALGPKASEKLANWFYCTTIFTLNRIEGWPQGG
jgi:hypothetical protein